MPDPAFRIEVELLKQLHLRVRIEGKIMERLDGSKRIHVVRFEPNVSISY